jgi:hypothetical protein
MTDPAAALFLAHLAILFLLFLHYSIILLSKKQKERPFASFQ